MAPLFFATCCIIPVKEVFRVNLNFLNCPLAELDLVSTLQSDHPDCSVVELIPPENRVILQVSIYTVFLSFWIGWTVINGQDHPNTVKYPSRILSTVPKWRLTISWDIDLRQYCEVNPTAHQTDITYNGYWNTFQNSEIPRFWVLPSRLRHARVWHSFLSMAQPFECGPARLSSFFGYEPLCKVRQSKDLGHFLYQSAQGKSISYSCATTAHILTLHCHIESKLRKWALKHKCPRFEHYPCIG